MNVFSKHLSVNNEISFRTEKLVKIYGEGSAAVRALNSVSIDVLKGDLVVLLGTSGSGKSTLLSILGGLDRPSSGVVFFENQELSKSSDAELTLYRRQKVGFVFQAYNLISSLTALENVELAAEISEKALAAEYALDLVGLKDRLHHFPSQLSGGEQQRVAIARAIVKQPCVLLCDEPTGALDSASGRKVLSLLSHVNKELRTTVVIVTHAAATASMADRVIHFADGCPAKVEINNRKLCADDIDW
ncbi:ABC transporter ATP-binding protein [Pseudovibrio brasiliensis]|uniref:ABC transporter ATP-binding protein n=1 Tax=Pseudovibrio brasiliensis TaxID=1898042 RepID=A0ABX8AVU8_9HYPH|nr:ABC transporter ATP-binding protein [Pseudovibrio brasiliensis]QUS59180.1 ABC transporter ATP-binding protein [Pseudovibrio brasiliensis]